jgi:hypothetical protein
MYACFTPAGLQADVMGVKECHILPGPEHDHVQLQGIASLTII